MLNNRVEGKMENIYFRNNRCKVDFERCIRKINQLENELDRAYRDENNMLVRKYFSELENLYDEYRYFKLRQLV